MGSTPPGTPGGPEPAGRLCVSVIEARHVQADTSSTPSFYVKLRVGSYQAKTDLASSTAPKFLKDLRLNVTNPSTDCLTVELLQQGVRGDLVIGKEQLRIASVMDKGTLVSWLPLISMDGDCAAELCIVMRYLSASAQRALTPSYGIAAREAKERALLGQHDPRDITKQPVSKSLFSDLPSTTASPGIPAHPGVQAPVTPTKHAGIAPAATSSPAAMAGGLQHGRFAGSNQGQGSIQDPQATALHGQQRGGRRRAAGLLGVVKGVSGLLKVDASKGQPVPLAVACGSVLGVMLYFLRLRAPTTGFDPEGDAPCAVGACFRQDAYDRYRQRYSAF